MKLFERLMSRQISVEMSERRHRICILSIVITIIAVTKIIIVIIIIIIISFAFIRDYFHEMALLNSLLRIILLIITFYICRSILMLSTY